MKTISILRTACAALLLWAGLATAQAQGVRVHYKDGNTVDIPAALFDHMSPGYVKQTDPDNPDDPDTDDDFRVDPLDINSAFVNTLKDAGMPIYTGSSAPTLNGTFSLKPPQLVKYWSTDPDDYDDLDDIVENAELVVKFAGQSGSNVYVDMYAIDEDGADYAIGASMYQGPQGVKAHIAGSGNKFTIGFVMTTEIPVWGIFIRLAYIMSGEVSGGTIKNLYIAEASLDKNNNIEEYAIGKDGDGTSPTTTWSPKIYTDDSRGIKSTKLSRRLLPKKATVTEEYWYTIYKTDGTELKLSQDELDYVETYEGEFDQRITQQIPQEYLEKMSAHMPIYSGNTPPAIEGSYVLSPLVLKYSSDGQSLDNLGDLFIRMTNQDTSKNTVMYEDKQASNVREKTEMVVLGKGNNFTLFAVVPGYTGNVTYKLATIVSGTMADNGIKDCYQAILMVDKDDPENKLMKVGTYRIFKDEDGLSSPTSWSSRSAVREGSGAGSISIMAAE
jgi:hypothetical protein